MTASPASADATDDPELAALGAELDEVLGPGRVRRDVPLGPLTTYRVGGPSRLFVEIADERDVTAVAGALGRHRCRVLVLGKGSNLLVADAGFPGLTVTLGESFSQLIEGPAVRVGGGAFLPVIARQTASLALSGFEWAVGVPGSIGGAVRMNAGGHGSDMAASVIRVRLVDLRSGRDDVIATDALGLRFRGSDISAHQLVLWAELHLEPGDAERSRAEVNDIVRWRREHQPGGQNAGSVFTNRPDVPAGLLIDQAGCKGLRIGTAAVSDKHANFIQADAAGSADDIWRLMQIIAERVETTSGIRLHPETRVVGFGPGDDA